MLPIHQKSGLIDFFELVRKLEKEHGFEFHDMAQRQKQQRQFCLDRGIDHAAWYSKRFTLMNELELEVKALSDALPYQNLWHWLIDNDFNSLERGSSVGSFDLSEARFSTDLPDYVLRFLRILRDELRSEGIIEDTVEFYIR